MKIENIRIVAHQLENPQFAEPCELVSWFGAMQAQNYPMVKWAVGIRLKNSTLQSVEKSLAGGEILRTHVLRPTWHLVAAEDIRWMCELSKKSVQASAASRDRQLGIDEKLFSKVNNLLEKFLSGNNHLTRIEISNLLKINKIETDSARMIHFMCRAETEGIVCSGVDKGKNQTYALLEERVKPAKKLNRDESLALLAKKYFQSHSPATLYDFAWWSGLAVSECRKAMQSIENELIEEKFNEKIYYIFGNLNEILQPAENLHFLPAFDEYIIAYKDRTAVLPLEHYPKAFTKNGTFFPTVLYNGKIIGNWDNKLKINYFEKDYRIKKSLLEKAENRYKKFMK